MFDLLPMCIHSGRVFSSDKHMIAPTLQLHDDNVLDIFGRKINTLKMSRPKKTRNGLNVFVEH